MTKIRTLKLGDAPIKILEAEQRRKGLSPLTAQVVLAFLIPPQKTAIDAPVLQGEPLLATLAPRASMLLVQDA